MSTTPSRVQPSQRANDADRTSAKRDPARSGDQRHDTSRIERQDWRGEGVVGDLHTD
ncbi:MAG TPA: hypothetical protein VN766_19965 [Stellaceae bacterium]|jgi:hypothetical protein|nr:hypothetical protein [Stellaceae bacterium]